jgi:hypothetical protein
MLVADLPVSTEGLRIHEGCPSMARWGTEVKSKEFSLLLQPPNLSLEKAEVQTGGTENALLSR